MLFANALKCNKIDKESTTFIRDSIKLLDVMNFAIFDSKTISITLSKFITMKSLHDYSNIIYFEFDNI